MNKQEIVTVLYELHKISGFRISLHSVDYTEIAAYPECSLPYCERVNLDPKEHKLCTECDRLACLEAQKRGKTYIYKCRFGLTEAVSPLYNFGVLSGYLMMGQIAQEGTANGFVTDKMRSFLKNQEDAEALIGSIPSVRADMISSYIRIMTICAQYLTLSNSTESVTPPREEMTKKYIEENLGRKLSLDELCGYIGCSRSTLLSSFKKKFGTTVGDYITTARLTRARQLLLDGRLTIGEIAAEVGFTDQSYFSKVFIARYKMTPYEFRHKEYATDSPRAESERI
jgi:AraC-like DNA-binding protein